MFNGRKMEIAATGHYMVLLEVWAQQHCDNLALAYGGFSQVPARAFAQAALGRCRNQGGKQPGREEVLKAIADVLDWRWAMTPQTRDEVIRELQQGWPVDTKI